MNRNRVFDDLNHVNDEFIVIIKSKKLFFVVWFMFKFVFIKIKNDFQYELNKLFSNISCPSYNIFNLFFIVDIFQKMIDYINNYVVEWYFIHSKRIHDRKWIFVIVNKLRTYIITYIYMKIHVENRMKNYWNTNDIKSLHFIVIKYIELNKWEQIDRFFRTFKSMSKQNVFVKIDELSEHLRIFFKLYWIFDIHFIVDENIQRFMKQIDEIVNISSKSISKNFKIWILINFDYVLNWLYHVKNDKKKSLIWTRYIRKIENFLKFKSLYLIWYNKKKYRIITITSYESTICLYRYDFVFNSTNSNSKQSILFVLLKRNEKNKKKKTISKFKKTKKKKSKFKFVTCKSQIETRNFHKMKQIVWNYF